MRRTFFLCLVPLVLLCSCSNNPFPRQSHDYKVRYLGFISAPKTLDPAVGYTAGISRQVRAAVYETLLEYHYLKRPYELMPGLAKRVPEPVLLEDGHVSYSFQIREGVMYRADACFSLTGSGEQTREMVASDFEFELKRVADPEVMCPVISPFRNILGLGAFSEKLQAMRRDDPSFNQLPTNVQYDRAGPIEGVRTKGPYELELILEEPYPQILYWLAMPFAAPVPWEAVVTYDGREGRDHFRDHPVGTGPYYLAAYDKEYRLVLQRNEAWYGLKHPEWKAPAATYPSEGEPQDGTAGLLSPEYVGRPLAFIERFEFRREKESTSVFSKFMQGYYDAAGIAKERFDAVIRENELSPDMAARGIRLIRSVSPDIGYLGFNMLDSVVGQPAAERGRKLRQAMSLVVDSAEFARIFRNGRGIPAQSPIPPGIFGYDAGYCNPYRQPDVEKARQRLAEAGYKGGIDPATGRPLRLTFDAMGTDSGTLLAYQFFVNAWRAIGLDVRIEATNYNQFQEKVRNGAYQIFTWGWLADYPDPENFLFLLWSEMARTENNGPNTANFKDPRYDELFTLMKRRGNDAERYRICREMVSLLEEECPWIPLSHAEDYGLYHSWFRNVKPAGMAPTLKYQDLDPAARAAYQAAHNRPIVWPLYVLLGVVVVILIPAVVTFHRERQ